MKIGITQKNEWNKKWKTIFNHYQQDLRHSYYVNSFLESSDKKVLEMGAGSFRDMANLNKLGVDCWGTDYSEEAVNLAKEFFPTINHKMFQSDAFDMNCIPDKEYDVTFHNGLWVLFNNDEDLFKLAKEQARISKNKIIVTVHNAHNKEFVSYFQKLSNNDDLYKIRFFTIDEITKILSSVCKFIEVVPVGKGKRFHEDKMINEGFYSREELKRFFDISGNQYLETSERLLCIGSI